MDIKQKLKDRLADHARLPMMPPGSENLARAALVELERQDAEIARLEKELHESNKALTVTLRLSPDIAEVVSQIAAAARKGEDS